MSMLPPISQATFAANPQFQVLYESLKLSKLDANGATKLDDKSATEQRVFEQAVGQARLKAAQQDILIHALTSAAQHEGISQELRESVAVIAALIDGHFADEDRNIVYDAIKAFKDGMPELAPLLARELQQDIDSISELLDADGQTTTLDKLVEEQQTAIATSRANLQAHKTAAVEQAVVLHESYRQITQLCVKILEQTVHGSEARAVKAKVDYLATVAEGMSKKASVQQNQLVSPIDTPAIHARLQKALRQMKAEDQKLKDELRSP